MLGDKLTPAQRMRALVSRQKLDRVPVIAMGSGYNAVISNISFKEFYSNPEFATDIQEKGIEMLGHDGSPSFGVPGWAGMDFGGKLEYKESMKFQNPIFVKRAVEKVEDIEKLSLPNIESSPGIGKMLEFYRLNIVRGRSVSLVDGSPMDFMESMLGSEKMLKWMYKEPQAVHRMLRIVTDYILKIADYFIDEFGIENCSAFEAFPMESNELMSPKMFEKFSLPYIVEIHEKLISKGVTQWSIHLCGDHTKNLPYWKNEIKLCSRTVFSLGNKMDILETGKFLGDEYIMGGNISTSLLQIGTYKDVFNKSKEIVEKMKYHPGGFILMPDCALSPLTPPLNVYAMIRATKLHGKY
jgi:uroporphyrinogen decarboxylase